jgi:hypothetical protein
MPNYQDYFTDPSFKYARNVDELIGGYDVPEGWEDIASMWQYGEEMPTLEDIIGTEKGFADLSKIYLEGGGAGTDFLPEADQYSDFMHDIYDTRGWGLDTWDMGIETGWAERSRGKGGDDPFKDEYWMTSALGSAEKEHYEDFMEAMGGGDVDWSGDQSFRYGGVMGDSDAPSGYRNPDLSWLGRERFYNLDPDYDRMFGGLDDRESILQAMKGQAFATGVDSLTKGPFQDIIVDPGAWEAKTAGRSALLADKISGFETARDVTSAAATDYGRSLRGSAAQFGQTGFAGSGQYDQRLGRGLQDYTKMMDENIAKRTTAYGDIGRGLQEWHEEDYGLEGEMGGFYQSAQGSYDDWLNQLREGWG